METQVTAREPERKLAAGQNVGLRLWQNEPPQTKDESVRDYETVGYVLSGRATVEVNGQTIALEPGATWWVPAKAKHRYEIIETFTAIEATSPPAN